MQGPVTAGNGVPDGLGATLARLFVKIERLGGDSGPPTPIEIHLTSGVATAAPTTCSAPSTDPCGQPGRGIAEVSGHPTQILAGAMALKLAGALYLSGHDAYRFGSSFEMALEGSLYAARNSRVGESSDLRLFGGNPAYLLRWGADLSTPAHARDYPQGTGSGALLGDLSFLLFPGWLRGHVLDNTGATVVVGFTAAEISPVKIDGETQSWLLPDLEAAATAGLPEGTFGILEVNYSGVATPSAVIRGAASNDAEIQVGTSTRAVAFIRGDCNGDGTATGALTDAVVLLLHAFGGGPAPPCLAACDANGDGLAGGPVADALYLLHYLFLEGPPPPAPFPGCGTPAEPAGLLDCTVPTC